MPLRRNTGGYPQESYENTDQFRYNSGTGHPIYPPLSEPSNITDARKSSAENPFRCKSSMSYLRDDPEPAFQDGSSVASETFKSLLVGQSNEGLGGDLLKKLEEAISRGDHK